MLLLSSRRIVTLLALFIQCSRADSDDDDDNHGKPVPLSVTPSVKWYGDDGSWSAITIKVGTPPQWMDVNVNTVSSETWVVDVQGCQPDTDCSSIRGGTFSIANSSTWQDQGFWDLGVDQQLGNDLYGDYGLEVLEFGTTGVSCGSAIICSFNSSGEINGTSYLLGSFGVGIVPGSFNNSKPVISALTYLVEEDGAIPSHSYGFTAGAYYQKKGVPMSLTLGGYDANRFEPNDVSFTLNPSVNPEVYINSIITTSANGTVTGLVDSTARISAVIDSSTAYLWLPKQACDHFANAFGLVYNDSLNLYVYNSSEHHDALVEASPTFTFSLCDVSASPDVVNITLPFAAFDLQLTVPAVTFDGPNTVMRYFPLRQAFSDDQYTIGRVFMQEAYIITNYENNSFSLHQAVHTLSPLTNTSIVAIEHITDSDFSGPPAINGKKLSKGVIAGISISAVAGTAILTLICLYWCRRRRRSMETKKPQEDEKSRSSLSLSLPFNFMDRLRRRGAPPTHEASGDNNFPAEVGACAEHERFELPAPLGPLELDSEDGTTTFGGKTEQGSSTQGSSSLTEYERARRKLEMQQIAAAKAQLEMETYPDEKSAPISSQDGTYIRGPDSPLVSPIGESGGSLTMSSNGASSPLSPEFMDTPVSPITSVPPPVYQRFSSSNVVYAGRLPNNIQLPQIVPTLEGRTIEGTIQGTMQGTFVSDPDTDSLGSEYTQYEEDLYGTGSPVSPSHPSDGLSGNVRSTRSDSRLTHSTSTRRLDGEVDLVHVPQPAENRFSWEEERTEGTD